MLLNLSKYTMYATTLFVILLQTFTTTHMLPMSAPLRTEAELQLLDPVFQSEQDDLESKKIVPKSVYNTVIRVTTTPCSPGNQRVREGGPCVTRYTGSGPVLDEEFQLSILKGITSLGGLGGSRRPSHNKNRNRHRTTTTPVPSTTTELPPTTVWTTSPIVDEEPPPSQTDENNVKKIGNMEVMDIEVDTNTKTSPIRPEYSPTGEMPLSIISSPTMSVSIPAPQQGPRPMPATTPVPSTQNNNNGSTDNVDDAKETKLPDSEITLSPGFENSPPPFPLIFGTKDDDMEKTTDPIIDFSTTMISMKGEDEIINVAFDVNPENEEMDEKDAVSTTTTEASSVSSSLGQNVMASRDGEGDKVDNLSKTGLDSLTKDAGFNESILVTQDVHPGRIVTSESAEVPWSSVESSTASPSTVLIQTNISTPNQDDTVPNGSSSPKTMLGSVTSSPAAVNSVAPVTIIIPFVVPQHFPTLLNFTEGENDTLVTDGNTRLLPDINGSQNTDDVHGKSPEVLTSTFITSPQISSTSTTPQITSSTTTSLPSPHKFIQMNDFEIDPTHIHHHHSSPLTVEDVEVKVEDIFQNKPKEENHKLLPNSKSDEIANSSILLTPSNPPPMTLAQEILSKLKPISHLLIRPQSGEVSSQQQTIRRGDIVPEDLESDLPINEFQEDEIDKSHHRSRSRNRAKNPEVLDMSSLSHPHHQFARSMSSAEIDGGGGNFGIRQAFPKMFVAPPGPVDYTRLGDKYRRFRVF